MSTQTNMLIFHLLVIALGIGLNCSNFLNTRLALANGAEFSKGLALQRRSVARLGDGVILLIWVTGGVLLAMRHGAALPGAFHVKLAFVIALTVFHVLARRDGELMRKAGNFLLLPRLSLFIAGAWISAMIALICAVIAFSS